MNFEPFERLSCYLYVGCIRPESSRYGLVACGRRHSPPGGQTAQGLAKQHKMWYDVGRAPCVTARPLRAGRSMWHHAKIEYDELEPWGKEVVRSTGPGGATGPARFGPNSTVPVGSERRWTEQHKLCGAFRHLVHAMPRRPACRQQPHETTAFVVSMRVNIATTVTTATTITMYN
jgi:hypothetical protein